MAERPLHSRLLMAAVHAGRALAARGPGFAWLMRVAGGPVLRSLYRSGVRLSQPITSNPDDPVAYRRWIRDNDSASGADRRALAAAAAAAPPVAIVPLAEAADAPRTGWVALLAPDLVLRDDAPQVLAVAARNGADAIVYFDEDRLDDQGLRRDPWLKPDWDIDRMLGGQDLIGGLVLIRGEALARLGLRTDLVGAELFDLALRAAAEGVPIAHLPKILAHRAGRDAPAARRRAVEDHLGGKAHLEPVADDGFRVIWPLPEKPPLVSLIVPTRDRADLVAQCAEGVLNRTDYGPLELLIVDNGSVESETAALFARLTADPRVRIISAPGPFNYSALNNQAAAEARGEVFVLLNNDVEVIGPGWLTELVSQALRPDVGAVGAKLLFGDGRMQHAGIVLGPGGVASYYHPFAERGARGYRGALMQVREVTAVTGACMAMRRAVFEAVGGLDAENLAVAFNDVDISLRIREAGYRNIWTPYAELYHHESATRGSDHDPRHRDRFAREIAYMTERWGEALTSDPFYNPNFSLVDGNHRLAWPPRTPKLWAL